MRLALEYVAAFLDCDGSISIVHSRRPNRTRDEYYAKINFYSQNLGVLYEIRDIVGGAITPPNTSMVHTLQLSPRSSIAAAKMLSPYLRIKQEQGFTVLELEKLNRSSKKIGKRYEKGGHEPVSDEVFAQRITLCQKTQFLNHKDAQAFRTNRVKSVELSTGETMPSQAAEGKGSAEGVTTREVSPNDNPLQETPARKGRDSLSSAISRSIQ
jgi:hypothetical protein